MSDIENVSWFVLRVRFNRAVLAQSDLSKLGIDTYLPMERRNIVVKGKKSLSKLMPIFPSYIFVRTTFEKLNDACLTYKYLSYLSAPENGMKRAIRIPEDQMTQFQEFIDGNYNSIEYTREKFSTGEKVIVTSGFFKGSEAIFIREKGKTYTEYVLEIAGHNVTLTANNRLERA